MSSIGGPLRVKFFSAVLALLLLLNQWFDSFLTHPVLGQESLGEEITVVAVGDILLSRHVGKTIDQAQDPDVPFTQVKKWLVDADLAFGNLESPIVPGNIPVRKGVVFRCLTRYVPALVNAGFDVLSTANNHAFDQGPEGIEYTLDYLHSQNIVAVGTRKKEDTTSFGRLIEKKGVKIGFLAYSYAAYNDGGANQDHQVATWHDREEVLEEIAVMKEKAEVLFVSIHAGVEYRSQPGPQKKEFARSAIEAGADAVIGHHPHWVQPIEIYQGKPIFYSLGNFVFDQGHSWETSQGLMVEFRIRDRRIQSARLIPVSIERFCCPRIADSETKEALLSRMGMDSDKLFFQN
jgi:poly-gamma-glutamate synthesis protein (capsule biosynthesis protein)